VVFVGGVVSLHPAANVAANTIAHSALVHLRIEHRPFVVSVCPVH
jgi:hypothetical protein